MARLVKHTAQEPAKVDPKGKPIFVCRCGVSDDPQGLCVGYHKETKDEKEGKLYCYDEHLNREEIEASEKEECCGGHCGCH